MIANFLSVAAQMKADLTPVAAKTGAETPTIYIYGPIFEGGADAKSTLLALGVVGKVKNLDVRINSQGGDVFESRAMGAVLRAHGSNITVYIDGLAASAAGELALSLGGRVVMAPGAFLMLHQASLLAFGNKVELRKAAELLDQVDATLVDTYAKKTGIKAAKIDEMLTAETWLKAADAKAGGWVDDVEGETITNKFDLSFYASAPKELLNQEPKPGRVFDALPTPNNKKEILMSTTATAEISAAVDAALAQKEIESQARISAAVKLAVESAQATAAASERNRITAINKLSQPGFESHIKAAIESGASPGDTALAIMTAAADRGITIGAIHKDSPPVIAGQPTSNADEKPSAWATRYPAKKGA